MDMDRYDMDGWIWIHMDMDGWMDMDMSMDMDRYLDVDR